MENYFNYFTEIEEHFCRRRGSTLLLSTLDWALIETWKDAGIPLEAVLRGIDTTFDKYESRPSRTRRVNSLAYCSQEVLGAAEDMKEAAVGTERRDAGSGGLGAAEIAEFLNRNASEIDAGAPKIGPPVRAVLQDTAAKLRALATELRNANSPPVLEDLERRLTVMEEKIFAALLASASDDEVVGLRAEADRELAPYRRKMPAAQIDQLQRQFVHKRLLEKQHLPRLSLFYL